MSASAGLRKTNKTQFFVPEPLTVEDLKKEKKEEGWSSSEDAVSCESSTSSDSSSETSEDRAFIDCRKLQDILDDIDEEIEEEEEGEAKFTSDEDSSDG